MKKFLLSCCLVLLSMSAYADIQRVDANLFSSTQGVCYGTSLNDTFYKCEMFYVCGNNPTRCSGGGCQPSCDYIPDYVWEYGRRRSGYVSLKNGQGFTHNGKSYFCCWPSGKSWGSFVQKDTWTTTTTETKELTGGGRCTYEVTTDACGNSSRGDCTVPTSCVGTFLYDGACLTTCPDDYVKYNQECRKNCDSDMPYLFDKKCVESCPSGTTANSDKKCVSSNDNSLSGGTSGDSSSGESSSSGSSSSGNSVNNTCESNEIKTKDGECKNKSDMNKISAGDMYECFRCDTIKSFTKCMIHECYKSADTDNCKNLGSSCVLGKD